MQVGDADVQSEGVIDRSWRRTKRLERLLSGGAGEWNFQRPKGMRQATFERLRMAYWDEERVRDDALMRFAASLGIFLPSANG